MWLLLATTQASAQDWLEDTTLANLNVGFGHSAMVQAVSFESYELEGGGIQKLYEWYSGNRRNLKAVFATSTGENSSLFWGFSTGEAGEKYKIAPSAIVGFKRVEAIGNNWTLSVSIMTTFGGYLKEYPCTAYYTLGGLQEVNCRYAASPIPPEETLDLLWDEPPVSRLDVGIFFVKRM